MRRFNIRRGGVFTEHAMTISQKSGQSSCHNKCICKIKCLQAILGRETYNTIFQMKYGFRVNEIGQLFTKHDGIQ